MSSTNVNEKNFFLEKNRMDSFKSWPFSGREKCSIKKVNFVFVRLCVKNENYPDINAKQFFFVLLFSSRCALSDLIYGI